MNAALQMTNRPAAVRSMTGFASVRRQTSAGELTISLRSVNHRGLDLHFHQIGEFALFENAMRALLKGQIRRGHVEVRVSLARSQSDTAFYNRGALDRYLSAFRQVSQDFKLNGEPDLNVLFTLPGVFEQSDGAGPLNETIQPELLEALSACAAELNAHREREGNALCGELEREADLIQSATTGIRGIRTNALPHFQTRLRERMSEILNGSGIPEARIAEEAALLADRSDIEEELTRLSVHTAELRRILAGGGEIGKRLDFLLQEMNREANTALSKSSGAGEPGLEITNLALGLKANIERIREQALNLE
ncbi:MAG TPA: YicC/YloC family endoribonuclease [Bryobacteraceae bacterium]|nr:YicC/YloC family endoribonuclease [Bryobacteraceae bacterium]